MKWTAAGSQIVGGRRQQEDRWAVKPWRDGLIAVVADGMGGHAGGAIASELAVDAFARDAATGEGTAAEALGRGLDGAAASVLARIREEPMLAEMGCTLVAIAVEQDRLCWISIGDSPLWIFHGGTLRKLNADHSMRAILADMVREGRITAEQAQRHPSRNALRSVIGRDPPPLVDSGELSLADLRGARLLLASDGIETLSEAAILELLGAARDAAGATKTLLAAIERAALRGQDNATVIVVTPKPDPAIRA